MKKTEWKDGVETPTDEDETVNRASALWARPKKDVTEDEYNEFYKHVAHDFEPPLAWSHNKRRRQAGIHLAALCALARAVRPLQPRQPPRHQALRAPRLHHGRRRAADAAIPALRARRDRLGRPAAQRLARDPAVEPRHRRHQGRLGEKGAGPAGRPGREPAREIRRILERVRQGAEGRPGRRLRQQGPHRRAAALCLHPRRHRRAGGLAQGLRRPHEGRPEGHLLHRRRQLRRRQAQPAPRNLPQERHRSAAAVRPRRRMADAATSPSSTASR